MSPCREGCSFLRNTTLLFTLDTHALQRRAPVLSLWLLPQSFRFGSELSEPCVGETFPRLTMSRTRTNCSNASGSHRYTRLPLATFLGVGPYDHTGVRTFLTQPFEKGCGVAVRPSQDDGEYSTDSLVGQWKMKQNSPFPGCFLTTSHQSFLVQPSCEFLPAHELFLLRPQGYVSPHLHFGGRRESCLEVA